VSSMLGAPMITRNDYMGWEHVDLICLGMYRQLWPGSSAVL